MFYIMLDDRTGTLRAHSDLAGKALAAALLAELGPWFELDDEIVEPTYDARQRGTVPRDALGHKVLDTILGQRPSLALKEWIAFLADTAEEEVADRLCRANEITVSHRRRLTGKVNVYEPARRTDAAWPRARLSDQCCTGRALSHTDAILVGLCHASGLLHDVLLAAPPGTYESAMQQVAAQLEEPYDVVLLDVLERMVNAKTGQLA
ncbi:hypothetical protein Ade02nite_23600 [Paractinoplanes deccanensis]|uniref:Golgi phosphoprotein 3 GPP34 n=1 Tax=Paractinoplanes deccanensis TaxID=113561 RepID=A0ABQ3Y141_9ACTN|nr:GPP34 family phosphoprotein [Actinoplanes deccanensis]GID73719.1 hypothetical protein Ade02nite_23600 [Actinoplanes deccanensis]